MEPPNGLRIGGGKWNVNLLFFSGGVGAGALPRGDRRGERPRGEIDEGTEGGSWLSCGEGRGGCCVGIATLCALRGCTWPGGGPVGGGAGVCNDERSTRRSGYGGVVNARVSAGGRIGKDRRGAPKIARSAARDRAVMSACGRGGLTLCIGNGLGVRRSDVAARRCAPDAGAVSEMRMWEKARSGGAAIAPSRPALCTVICDA